MKKIHYIDFENIKKCSYNILIKGKFKIDGLNSGSKIEKFLNRECLKKGINNINQIKKTLLIPSVDLCNGKVYIFSSAEKRKIFSDKIQYINNIEIGKAVRASCSYPGVFSPVEYNNTYLIDGGIRENVPWKELKENGAEKIISIIFQNELVEKNEINIMDVVTKSIDLLCHELSNYELEGAENLIKIKTKNIHLLDKKKMDFLYELGYKETKKFIKRSKM